MEGGGGTSKNKKLASSKTSLGPSDEVNISLSLSNSSPNGDISPLKQESSVGDNPNIDHHMGNGTIVIRPMGSSSGSSSSTDSAITVEGSHRPKKPSSGCDGAGAMVLAGCPRCLMYVMLRRQNPRCPKCNNSTLLNFFNGD